MKLSLKLGESQFHADSGEAQSDPQADMLIQNTLDKFFQAAQAQAQAGGEQHGGGGQFGQQQSFGGGAQMGGGQFGQQGSGGFGGGGAQFPGSQQSFGGAGQGQFGQQQPGGGGQQQPGQFPPSAQQHPQQAGQFGGQR